jgi:hypothetical protein
VKFVKIFLENYNDNNKSNDNNDDDKSKYVEYKLTAGHLFDRLITTYVLSGKDKCNTLINNNNINININGDHNNYKSDGNINDNTNIGENLVATKKISVTYMLTGKFMYN